MDSAKCRDRALKLLAMREHSRRELELKLVSKGFSPDETGPCLDQLEQEGWLSDERFCESYIRSRLRRQPEGRAVLLMRLREKGVSPEAASAAVDSYFTQHEEEIMEIFRDYASSLEARKGREKAQSVLYRKGIRIPD